MSSLLSQLIGCEMGLYRFFVIGKAIVERESYELHNQGASHKIQINHISFSS